MAHDWRGARRPGARRLVGRGGRRRSSATRRSRTTARGASRPTATSTRTGSGRASASLIVGLTERRAAEQLEAVTLPRVVMQNTVLHVGPGRPRPARGPRLPPRPALPADADRHGRSRRRRPRGRTGVVVAPFHPEADLASRSTRASRRRSPMSGAFAKKRSTTWRRRKLEDPALRRVGVGDRARGRRGVRRRALDGRAVRHGVRERARRASGMAAARARPGAASAGVHLVLGAGRAPRRARRRHREPDRRAPRLYERAGNARRVAGGRPREGAARRCR